MFDMMYCTINVDICREESIYQFRFSKRMKNRKKTLKIFPYRDITIPTWKVKYYVTRVDT